MLRSGDDGDEDGQDERQRGAVRELANWKASL